MWLCASARAAKPVRAQRSSTAGAPKRRKKGASIDPQGFDAGKKVAGRKRHILVDTLGLMLGIVVHPGNVQDRDGAGGCINGIDFCCAQKSRATRYGSPGFLQLVGAGPGTRVPV